MPSLPIHDGPSKPTTKSRSPLILLLILPVLAVVHIASPFSALSAANLSSSALGDEASTMVASCPIQGKALVPKTELVLPEGYRAESADRLSQAVVSSSANPSSSISFLLPSPLV